jgi:hypothetical protein
MEVGDIRHKYHGRHWTNTSKVGSETDGFGADWIFLSPDFWDVSRFPTEAWDGVVDISNLIEGSRTGACRRQRGGICCAILSQKAPHL